jgi:tRNA(Ile2) C34 agmatinyltransferase TiaS
MLDAPHAWLAFAALLLVALVIAAGWREVPECDRCGCEMEWVDGFHGKRWRCAACGHRRPA